MKRIMQGITIVLILSVGWFLPTTVYAAPGAFSKLSPTPGATGVELEPTLTWESSLGATQYAYCVATSTTCTQIVYTTNTWADLAPLDPATKYYWQVCAVNVSGYTCANGDTGIWNFTTIGPPGSFSKTNPVNAATSQPSSVTLTWEASRDATSYLYCIYTYFNYCASPTTVWTDVGAETSATLSDLAPNTTYHWQVLATNIYGQTGANDSTWWTFSTNRNPTGINLSNSSIYENKPVDTGVGVFSSADPDPGDTFTYSLVTGGYTCPGTNNAAFHIDVATLKSSKVFDYETKKTYSICVQTSDGHGGTFRKPFSISINNLAEKATTIFRSLAAYDGWILESGESTTTGGTLNSMATTINLGDNAANKEYRAILSFNTAAIPDGAVIVSVTLKAKYAALVGTNPFTTSGALVADVERGVFGGSQSLQLADFQMAADKSRVLSFSSQKENNWYAKALATTNFGYINKTGMTQFRMRFSLDDNNNRKADYIQIYSGNALTANQPQLIITYSMP